MLNDIISKSQVSFWIPLVLPLIGLAISWGVLATRVSAVEAEATTTRVLLERVIILEEKNRAIQEDVSEIKADVKYIRQQIKQ